ncbi:MAG: D-alanine--D-alanine ligase [Eggerthellaceae bacterium]|nr:D-alanine--D-alanine ligase [Eggerthellaceae bacterium]
MALLKKDIPNIHVALIAGGTSGERDISIASGDGAEAALREAGFQVTRLDSANKDDLVTLINSSFDVAFLCLHGKGGEDGSIQGLLEIAGIPYTGPGVWSSATAIDKTKSKLFYERANIPTPASITVSAAYNPEDLTSFAQQAGFPLVVKPATEGSALGVEIVQAEADLPAAIERGLEIDTEVLIEQYIAGTEITVAVLGNAEPFALPVIQIVPRNSFYDFDAKYAPGGSQHICPAPLSDEVTARAQELGIAAHKALECRCMSRTDMIVDEEGLPWVLETNTIPGMTQTSLLPDAAAAAGISFPELCVKLIEFALE